MFLTPMLGYFGLGLKLRARPDQDRMRCFDTKRTVASIGAAQSMARPKENGPSRFEGRAIVARGGYETRSLSGVGKALHVTASVVTSVP
jgi:hypothetical protein